MSSCGQQAQTRGLKHLFVMADSFLHQAGMTAGLTRSLTFKGIAMTPYHVRWANRALPTCVQPWRSCVSQAVMG